MARRTIGKDTAQRIADEWLSGRHTGVASVMKAAGVKSQDMRTLKRYRRASENILNIELPSLNPEFKSEMDTRSCPSYLDYDSAKKKTEFVITSATNNSNLNAKFFDTLEAFADGHDAQLLVCPIRYWHNSLMGRKDYKWDERIYPYVITDKDFILNKSIQVSALTANATAVDPLSGVKPLGGPRSVIYGATSLHMRCLPTHGKDPVKVIHTTGSCTAKTYTRSTAGMKAKFHHNFSAVYVKLIGDKYLHTQIEWDGKGFTFLNEYWTPSGVSEAKPCAAIIRGDDHAEWQDEVVLKARAVACDLLKPKIHVFHDVFDAVSVSHHTQLLDKVKVYKAGMHLLEAGLKTTAELIDRTGGEQNYIIADNHSGHLERYVNEGRHLKEPHNFALASKLAAESLEGNKSMLQCYLERHCKRKLTFPSASKKKLIKGIDVSQHGHKGANGSRGGMKQFAAQMYKICVAHGHSSWIYQNAWASGVSTKGMTYATGLSSWTLSDILITATGKRFILFYIDGKSLVDYA